MKHSSFHNEYHLQDYCSQEQIEEARNVQQAMMNRAQTLPT